jgi:hypothetical protein
VFVPEFKGHLTQARRAPRILVEGGVRGKGHFGHTDAEFLAEQQRTFKFFGCRYAGLPRGEGESLLPAGRFVFISHTISAEIRVS